MAKISYNIQHGKDPFIQQIDVIRATIVNSISLEGLGNLNQKKKKSNDYTITTSDTVILF